VSADFSNDGWNRFGFAYRLLQKLGAPVSNDNLKALLGWMAGENTNAMNNPLATTRSADGHTTPYNTFSGNLHVWNYDTPQTGLQATYDTLTNGRYDNIVEALRRGTTIGQLAPLVSASAWGTKQFDYNIDPTDAKGDGGILLGAKRGQGQPGNLSGGPNGTNSPATQANAPISTTDTYLPGGQLMITNGTYVVRYAVDPAAKIFMEWKVTDLGALARSGYDVNAPAAYTPIPQGESLVPYQESGDLAETGQLSGLGYASMAQWFTDFIAGYYSTSNPAIKDPGVLAVIARVAANPDTVSQSTVAGWIRNTDYWKNRTAVGVKWDNASPAEQQNLTQTTAQQVADDYWRLTGQKLGISDPKVVAWAEQVASGQSSYSAVYQQIVAVATASPDSPWNRSIYNEHKAQQKIGNNVENQYATFKQDAIDWGLQLSDPTLQSWATKVSAGDASEADWQKFMQTQAQVLYPWKDAATKTVDAAGPWLNAYARILETSTPDLTNPTIQQALQSGTPLFQFNQELRKKPEWLQTQNARTTINGLSNSLARRMGFA